MNLRLIRGAFESDLVMDIKPAPACGVMMRTLCFPDEAALADALCAALVEVLSGPHAKPAGILLAGGSTPLAAYARLSRQVQRVDTKVYLFFSDDRHVPPNHPQSNYRNIAPLLKSAGIPNAQIIRVEGERPLAEAVEKYARAIDDFFQAGGHFPLGLLGLGADGHTASLFSADDLARGKDQTAVGVQRPDGLAGVSLTAKTLMRIERLIFAVTGVGKRQMAETLVRNPTSIIAGQVIRGHRAVELWSDRAAWPF